MILLSYPRYYTLTSTLINSLTLDAPASYMTGTRPFTDLPASKSGSNFSKGNSPVMDTGVSNRVRPADLSLIPEDRKLPEEEAKAGLRAELLPNEFVTMMRFWDAAVAREDSMFCAAHRLESGRERATSVRNQVDISGIVVQYSRMEITAVFHQNQRSLYFVSESLLGTMRV
jgi:hypothetical protein